MPGLRKTTKDAILNAKSADMAIALLRKLIRERMGNEYEDSVQLTANRGKYEIAFPHANGFSIRRPGLSRAKLLEFVAGLQRD